MLRCIKHLLLFLLCAVLLFCTACKSNDTPPSEERVPKTLSGVWTLSDPLVLPDRMHPSHKGFARGETGEICFCAVPESYAPDYHCISYSDDAALTSVPYPDGGYSAQHPEQFVQMRFFDSAEEVYCIHYNQDNASLSYYGTPGHTHSENEPQPTVITFDEEDRRTVRDLISGITVRADALPDVCDIIYEDASAYFAGAKTLDETVSVIVSRTELYFSERS